MPFSRTTPLPTALLAGLVFWSGLISLYLVYRGALPGILLFDDGPNLSGLARIADIPTLLAFIFGGSAGPGGRPLALASFALNAGSWPNDLPALLHVNFCIHLINACLVTWLLLRTALALGLKPHPWLAILAGLLWASAPLLASTSLMVVQRMTSLSVCFSLLVIHCYLGARMRMAQLRPQAGGWGEAFLLAFCMTLALLAKESALVLPGVLLAIEATILRQLPRPDRFWRCPLLLIGIVFPIVITLAYLLWQAPVILSGYETRAFTLEQRLLTETRILWRYFVLLLAPRAAALGPLQDDYPLSTGWLEPVTTSVSILAWIALIAAAWKSRRRHSYLALAVFWWLAAHWLESSVLSLELYFEHRNYLPAVGIVLALYLAIESSPDRTRWVQGGLLMTLWLGLNVWILSESTRIWSNPQIAARIWHEWHPTSPRASQLLAQILVLEGSPLQAHQIIDQVAHNNPDDIGLALQNAQMACQIVASDELRRRLIHADDTAATSQIRTFAAIDTLSKLIDKLAEKSCPGLDADIIRSIVFTLQVNPAFASHAAIMANLHFLLARLHDMNEDRASMINEVDAALRADPSPDFAITLAALLASSGLYEQANSVLDDAMKHAPRNPFARFSWEQRIMQFRDALNTTNFHQNESSKLEH